MKKIKKIIETHSPKIYSPDSVLRSLQITSDLVIGYASYNASWSSGTATYYLFCYSKKRCLAYKYSQMRVYKPGEKPYRLDTIKVSKKVSDSVLTAAWKNKIWKLKSTEAHEEDPCGHLPSDRSNLCSIHDALSKALYALTKKHYASSSYYAPEYYEYECCPGNIERQAFLAIIKPLYNFFRGK